MKVGKLKKLLAAMPDEGEVTFTLNCARVVAQATMVWVAKGDEWSDEVECLDCENFHIEYLRDPDPHITICVEPCDGYFARLCNVADQFEDYYQRIEKDEK